MLAVALSCTAASAPATAQEFSVTCTARLYLPRVSLALARGSVEFQSPSDVALIFYLDPDQRQARVERRLFSLAEGSPHGLQASRQSYVVAREGAQFVEALGVTVVQERFDIDRIGGRLEHSLVLSDGRRLGQLVQAGRCRRAGGRL
jgi:hypothetical protein